MGAVSINPDPRTSLSQAHMLTVFMAEGLSVLKIQRCIFYQKDFNSERIYSPERTIWGSRVPWPSAAPSRSHRVLQR